MSAVDIAVRYPVAADISAREARRLSVRAALGTQHERSSREVLLRLGLLQLDALQRIDRAHRLTCLARMSPDASVTSLDDDLWSAGEATAFETWVHAACLVPVEDWPLLRLAREKAATRDTRPSERACDDVLSIVAASERGVTIHELEEATKRGTSWDWSERKRAAEHLIWRGELVCSERRSNRRIYDLPERRLPRKVLTKRISRSHILGTLVRRALGAMGIATMQDVAVHYNLTPNEALEGLVNSGAQEVTVEGWAAPGWLLGDLSPADSVIANPTLIGPFDNLLWDRNRARRVHDFNYTFEAYKPASKRIYGHYVMGVIASNGDFIGRIDAQRHDGRLEVMSSYAEPGVSAPKFRRGLHEAIDKLARQMNLRSYIAPSAPARQVAG